MRRLTAAIIVFWAFGAAHSYAAEKCFEKALGDPALVCSGGINPQGSSDFAERCAYERPEVMVEVECQGDAVWMPTVLMTASIAERGKLNGVRLSSHAAVPHHEWHCGQHGMMPATVDGQMCASSNNRPTRGAGWESIVYPFAPKGTPSSAGGSSIAIHMPVVYFDVCMPARRTSAGEAFQPDLPVAIACKPCPNGPCPQPRPIPTGMYGPNKYSTWYWNETTEPTARWLELGYPR